MLRVTGALIVLIACFALSGCASKNDPQLSGFGLFNSRTVTQGEMVTLKIPTPEGTPLWRIVSFDSVMLAQRGFYADGSDMVVRYEARTPGETEIVLRESKTGEEQTLKVTILGK
jgi:hypothetical protein